MGRPRSWLVLALPVAGLLLAAFVLRTQWMEWALRGVLVLNGASQPRLRVERAEPTRLELTEASWKLGSQPWSIDRLEIQRSHWYSPDFGDVRLEGLRATIPLEPHGLAAPAGQPAAPQESPPLRTLPVRSLQIDGQLEIKGGTSAQNLKIGLKAAQTEPGKWVSDVVATAPGLDLAVKVETRLQPSRHDFNLQRASLDLAQLQDFGAGLLGVAPRDYRVGGTLVMSAEGQLSGNRLSGQVQGRLREGRIASVQDGLSVEGIEAEVQIEDLATLTSARAQTIAIRSARRGEIAAANLHAALRLRGPTQIDVQSLSLDFLGGRLSAEPFAFDPRGVEIRTTVLMERLNLQDALRLVRDLPATASGQISGRVPVTYSPKGILFGRGWIGLPAGQRAVVEFQAEGLLTGGMKRDHPGYPVLRQIETGLLKLAVAELRLDLHPDGPDAERSATLKLAGEPVDRNIRAPVVLDLNFRGPIEELLNASLSSAVKSAP